MTLTDEVLTIRPLPVAGDLHEACTPADAPRLDPIVGGRPTPGELDAYRDAARELCARCPVIDICAAEGDRTLGVGVWGGSLRYRAGGDHGEYRVVPLIPQAVPSTYGWEGL